MCLLILSDKTSTLPTAIPMGEFNKDLTATQQVATPKSASQTSLNSDIKLNSVPNLLGRVQLNAGGIK